VEIGVPPGEVDRLVSTAVAWRVTPGGRPLIDRRRQSRLARNVRIVAAHLEAECGVELGASGVAAVFRQVPELMLCKPTSNDRWDRRAVELAAYRLRAGHCNVPETWETNVELGVWVKRQRVARAAGQLSAERLQILERMGFEFGDLAQVTEEWEHRFDQLIDWVLWHGENRQRFSWAGADWGERGGATARELALWLALQREFRRRALLPAEAVQRFEAIHVEWEPVDGTPEEREWMGWAGRLLFVAEKRCTALRRPSAPRRKNAARPARGGGEDDYEEEEAAAPRRGPQPGAQAARLRLASGAGMRQAALATGPLVEEPGLGFWLARQRWLWRQGRLPAERVLMLHLAGADMDAYSPTEWQSIAHTAAAVAQGSRVTLGVAAPPQAAAPPPPPAAAATPGKRGRRRAVPAAPALARGGGGSGAAAASPAPPPAGGSLRLRARRWVQAQRAMFAAGRLSAAQLRYLSFLGLTWVLSDEVVREGDATWQPRCAALRAAAPAAAGDGGGGDDWARHQRALRALGLLPAPRRAALDAAGLRWAFPREADADEWDARLSQLLTHSAELGALPVDDAGPLGFPGLAAWLAGQRAAMAAGGLTTARAAQLAALGVAPAGGGAQALA
jgi:hypothetical protein